MATQGFSSANPFKRRDTAAGFGARLRSGQGTTTGGTRRGSGGSSRIGSTAARDRAAAEKRAAEAKAKAAAEAKKAAEAQIAAAKTQAQKTALAREYIEGRKATTEKARILQYRSNLIKQGVSEQTVTSKDYRSGDILIVSQWRDKKGNRVERIVNKDKGTTTYSSFKRVGGRVRKTGGITESKAVNVAASIASKVKINFSDDPKKFIVTFPNGQTGLISNTGTVTVGSRLAGNKYTFKDGRIIMVNDKAVSGVVARRQVGEVTRVKEDTTTAARWSKSIRDIRGKLNTARARGDIKNINEAKLLGWAFVGTILDGGRAFVALPSVISNIVKNPSILKQIPASIDKGGKEFGILLQTSPSEAFGVIAGEIVLLKGTNAAIKQVGGLSSKVFTRLNPKYVGKANIGRNLRIKTARNRAVNLKVAGKIPKEKLLSQVNKQGKRLTAISSQADDWIGLVKRKGVIRKPIPGEAGFNQVTKNLIKKLDKGTLTKNELFDLDLLVRSQGAKGLLERGFFADPTGKIRPSRLGVVDSKKAGLLDYLSGDITFKKARPQIFLFDDIKVAKFPSGLRGVAKKLKSGKTLTRAEANALLEWQLKKTGKFKPVGFISGESEITLAPGEILRKVKTVGVTSVSGRRVPIIKVSVLKQSPVIKNLIKKLDDGVITAVERARLNKILKKATGFNYGTSSSRAVSSKYVPIRRIGLSALSIAASKLTSGKISPRLKSKPRLVSKTGKSLRTYKKSGKSPSKAVSKKVTSKRAKSPARSPKSPKKGVKSPARSPKSPKKVVRKKAPVIKINVPKGYTRKRLKKDVKVYYVKVRKAGKIKNLNPRPLTKSEARDLGVYFVDHGTTRSFWLEPIGTSKTVVRAPSNIRGYYAKNSRKVRPFKIRAGRAKAIRDGYIEKSKYVGDRKSEIRELQRSKRKTSVKRKAPVKNKKSKKRKLTPAQRKIMLTNLKKARAKIKKSRKKK